MNNEVVLRLFKDMGLQVSAFSIDRSHRNFGKPGKGRHRYPPDILVKFVAHDVKDYVFRNRNILRHLPEYKNVFIDEQLTNIRSELFREIRQSLSAEWEVYTYDGSIFVYSNKSFRMKPVKITCKRDFVEFCEAYF